VPLIPTGLRDKLPRGLSHPVGAEAISRALAGCPRYEELWTAFGRQPLPLYPALTDDAEFRLAFQVVCNNHTGTWSLSVPAVPSGERAAARQVLAVVGLQGVREWLCRSRPQTWHEGFRTFQVGYAIEPLRVCFVESLNYRVVASSVAVVEEVGAETGVALDPST
jgi:hypothetical protein